MAFGSIFIFIATGYDSIDEYWLRTLTIWKKMIQTVNCIAQMYIYISVWTQMVHTQDLFGIANSTDSRRI